MVAACEHSQGQTDSMSVQRLGQTWELGRGDICCCFEVVSQGFAQP